MFDRDVHDTLKVIGQGLTSIIRLRWRKNKAPDESGWKPLSKQTKKWKIKKGYSPSKILLNTGQLQNSLSNRVRKNELIIAINDERAPDHQFGIKAENLPARPMLDLEGTNEKEQAFIQKESEALAERVAKKIVGV